MAGEFRALRRVVTGNDARGRSCVLFDSDAPNTRPAPAGGGMTEMWCFSSMPTSVAGSEDLGLPPFTDHPPRNGLFLRFVQSLPPPPDYDPAEDPKAVPEHPPTFDAESGRGDRGGRARGRSPIHRTQSVDYGIVIDGGRSLILDETRLEMGPGDVVVQLGNFHQWAQPDSDTHSLTAFVMMGGTFD